jgi:xanthine dehydrogenase accessory factor
VSDPLLRAADLHRAGDSFVVATVVRSRRPASARPGDRAILRRDGSSEGWVGGGCVQACVEREAARALSDGRPRLLRLSPNASGDTSDEEGVVSYPMTCHSGGELEIYLEPVTPAPRLAVVGASPVSSALAELGTTLGFDVRRAPAEYADAWVVVAAMGEQDEAPVLRAALTGGARYVGLVASRRRADQLRDHLRQGGVDEVDLARLKAPAGLDIGAATGAEIALSILGEIVQLRRTRPRPAPPVPLTATDPVCGMQVDTTAARWTLTHAGETIYFCAPGCRRAYAAEHALPV